MTWRARGAALLREPLVHFLVLGALVFALFGDASSPEERRIVVDAARVERLAGQFAQTFRRLPSEAELDALIREDVRDEVYYREGLRLGLDRDDDVVRRRMRQKMEAFAVSPEDVGAPDEATLRRWLAAHPERFAGEARYGFEQRYLGAGDGRAARALAALRAGGVFAGKPIPLPARFADIGAGEVAGLFGEDFAAALDELPLGVWSGPVASGFGQHLVMVRQRRPAAPPPLAAIRQRVNNDWRAAQARARTEAAYRKMLARYDVTIARP